MSGIPAERYAARLAAARVEAAAAGLDVLCIGVGADLRHLTGYEALPLERLTMLLAPAADGVPLTLIAPRLEATPARTCAAAFVLGLQRVLPYASFIVASTVLRRLRMRKDTDEVALLRRAAQAADRVVLAIANGRLVGRTEADVAREVRERLLGEGHEVSEFSIVASGPNSASPHHDAGERVIQGGEPIVLDIGGQVEGYGSDITRTMWVTGGDATAGPDPEFLRLYEVLQRAQAVASEAVRPGVACEAIDAAAREVITEAGFGPNFFHRTGHGIGLEGHEEPYLVEGNAEPMAAGYTFSVEPGIYLEGRYGARIEDIVVCTDTGGESLNEAPRDLLVVAG